ncbi:MAG: nucleoside kinase, partial [Treponema sp.]|nr:nucleoside kinase [Treponema sp.]
MKDISITFVKDGKEITKKQVPYGTPVSVITGNFGIPEKDIFAVTISNEICPLDMPLTYDAILEPVLAKSKEGASVYRRSLCLLLASAAHNLFPKARLLVGHSLGYGYYYTLEDADSITEKDISALSAEMKKLVTKDIPITTETIPYDKACEL